MTQIVDNEKLFNMKILLSVLIFIFGLQYWAKADNIRDFEIEGMSLYQSALNFFSQSEIKNNEEDYYNNKTFPIDIHCPAQLFVTLSKLDQFKKHEDLANRVMRWMIENMQDKKGYFYYQKKNIDFQ